MNRCEAVREVWERLRTPDWCRGGLCGANICADPLLISTYERAVKDIAWEMQKKDYIFRFMSGERCVTTIYSDKIRDISFNDFINQIATTIHPRGNCPPKLYLKISMLKSDMYCVNDIAKLYQLTLNDVLACLGEAAKERDVVVKAVGETYFAILGPVKRINSPLFR